MEPEEVARAVRMIVPWKEVERARRLMEDGEEVTQMDWRAYMCPPSLISVACGLRPAGGFLLQRRELERAEPYYRRLCGALSIRYEVVPPSFSWVRWFLHSCFRVLPLALLRCILRRPWWETKWLIVVVFTDPLIFTRRHEEGLSDYMVAFARDGRTLKRLRRILEEEELPKRSRLAGRIFGYPECCIRELARWPEHPVDRESPVFVSGSGTRDDPYVSKFREEIEVNRKESQEWRRVRRFVWHKPCRVKCPETEALARRVEEALSAVYFEHPSPSVEDRDV